MNATTKTTRKPAKKAAVKSAKATVGKRVSKVAKKAAVPKPAKKELCNSGEYMRQRRLRLNPNVYSRISVKCREYLTVEQAMLVENFVDLMLALEPRNSLHFTAKQRADIKRAVGTLLG